MQFPGSLQYWQNEMEKILDLQHWLKCFFFSWKNIECRSSSFMLHSSRKGEIKALDWSQLKCTACKNTCTFTHVSVQTADGSLTEALDRHLICFHSFLHELRSDSTKKGRQKKPCIASHGHGFKLNHIDSCQTKSKMNVFVSNCWPT